MTDMSSGCPYCGLTPCECSQAPCCGGLQVADMPHVCSSSWGEHTERVSYVVPVADMGNHRATFDWRVHGTDLRPVHSAVLMAPEPMRHRDVVYGHSEPFTASTKGLR